MLIETKEKNGESMSWKLNKIPKIIHFYWGDNRLTFLRYLSVYSFRKLNPDWVVKIHKPLKPSSNVPTWETQEQKNKDNNNYENYYQRLLDLNVDIEYHDISKYGFPNEAHEVHKSDFLRWHLLSTCGGVWSDFDIIYTKPISLLSENVEVNKNKNTFLCKYKMGVHAIGFMMSSENNLFFKHIKNISSTNFNKKDYQSIGSKIFNDNFMTESFINNYVPGIDCLFLNPDCVYKIDVNNINDFYSKNIQCPTEDGIIGFHWYAGHNLAQKFDKIFTEDNYKTQINTISNIIDTSLISSFSLHENSYEKYISNNNNIKFKIIIPAYNCDKYIYKCLESVIRQNYKNWECIVIDDCSNDSTGRIAERYNDKIKIHHNDIRNSSAIKNILFGIKKISNQDNDVIVNLDGDDWFAHNYVLDYLSSIYNNDTWVTYGQYEPLSLSMKSYPSLSNCTYNCKQVPDSRTYRKMNSWYTSHLRTFRKFLFDKINEQDLKDSNGEFFKTAGDLALMYPLIEMAGNARSKFIDKILYIYNDLNVMNDMKIDPIGQLATAAFIKNKKEYGEI